MVGGTIAKTNQDSVNAVILRLKAAGGAVFTLHRLHISLLSPALHAVF